MPLGNLLMNHFKKFSISILWKIQKVVKISINFFFFLKNFLKIFPKIMPLGYMLNFPLIEKDFFKKNKKQITNNT